MTRIPKSTLSGKKAILASSSEPIADCTAEVDVLTVQLTHTIVMIQNDFPKCLDEYAQIRAMNDL